MVELLSVPWNTIGRRSNFSSYNREPEYVHNVLCTVIKTITKQKPSFRIIRRFLRLHRLLEKNAGKLALNQDSQ